MQVIILAAGLGRRLGELTSNNTKCMVKVNGIRLIDRLLEQLSQLSLQRIVLVIGYEGRKLRDYLGTSYGLLTACYSEVFDEPWQMKLAPSLLPGIPQYLQPSSRKPLMSFRMWWTILIRGRKWNKNV